MKLIYYGKGPFDPSKFKPIKNNPLPDKKPFPPSGLWTSPLNSGWGWKEWNEVEDYRECKENFVVELSESARIFKIDCEADLANIPIVEVLEIEGVKFNIPALRSWGIDFEKLAEDYDAFWLTERGQSETRFSRPFSLYGWYVESVLVFRADVLTQISHNQNPPDEKPD